VREVATLFVRASSRVFWPLYFVVMNCQLKQAACSWSYDTVLQLRYLASLETSVWLHDGSPGARRDDARREGASNNCSTPRFLPSTGFSAGTRQTLYWKGASRRSRLPRGCLRDRSSIDVPTASLSSAFLRQLKQAASRRGIR